VQRPARGDARQRTAQGKESPAQGAGGAEVRWRRRARWSSVSWASLAMTVRPADPGLARGLELGLEAAVAVPRRAYLN